MNTDTIKQTMLGQLAFEVKKGNPAARIQYNQIARVQNLTAREPAVHRLCDQIKAGLKPRKNKELTIFQRLMSWI